MQFAYLNSPQTRKIWVKPGVGFSGNVRWVGCPERVFVEEEYSYEVDVSIAGWCLRMRLLGRKAIGCCWKATAECSSPRGLHTPLLKFALGGIVQNLASREPHTLVPTPGDRGFPQCDS